MEASNARSSSRRLYPLFISLSGRKCLVVGGGPVGERKVKRLVDYGAQVSLVAEQLTPWLQDQQSRQQVTLLGRRYRPDHTHGMALVFAATNNRALNRQIASDARRNGIWCNMATDPELGDVLLPSIYEQGSLCIAFSTGGMAPGVAKLVREQFERDFGPEWVAALDLLGRLRMTIKNVGLQEPENTRIFRDLAALSIQDRIVRQKHEEMIEAIAAVCGPYLTAEEIRALWKDTWKQHS